MKRRRLKRSLSLLCILGLLGSGLPFAVADQSTPRTELMETEWEALQQLLSGYTAEWTDTSYEGLITNRVPHTALLGNGDVGVASGGDDYSKNFYISKSDFWGYNDGPKAIGGVIIKTAEEPVPVNVSLAQGKTVTASSAHGSFPPSRALNGQWREGYEGWVSNVGNPQWMEIDLGAATTFDRIVIKHDAAARGNNDNNTMVFSVSVRATAAEEWRVVYETADNHDAITDVTLEKAVSAQYVRLDVTKGTQETTTDTIQNPRARIGQFELYNTADAPTVPTGPVPTENFYEAQDILNARILTKMELDSVPVEMDTKMLATENLLVTKLTSKGDTAVNLTAQLWAKNNNGVLKQTALATADSITVTRSIPKANSNDTNSFTTQAALSTKIIGADVTSTVNEKEATADLVFTLPAGETVYIVTAIGGGGRTYNYKNELQGISPSDQAAALLEKASLSELEELASAHAAWWKDYWMASSIRLDETNEQLALIQKYYYGAQYQLGCTLRNGEVAPGLYGIWHTTDNPSWKSDYHLNYNFISSFYGVATSNRAEHLLSVIESIVGFVEEGPSDMATIQKFATKNETMKEVISAFVDAKIADGSIDPEKGIEGGVLFPVGIGPWGMNLDQSYHNQTFNAPFSAYPLIQYYEATQDEDFLREVLYEYLKPILTLLKAWVVEDEQGVYNIYAGYNEGSWAKNSVGELGVYRMCLEYALMAAETFDIDHDLQAEWQDLMEHLAPYPVIEYNGKQIYAMADQYYENGEWKDWTKGPTRLTMEPVFPAGQFGYYSTPEELEIWQNTLQVLDDANTWHGINCFPELYLQAFMMRYDTQTVLDQFTSNIERLIQTNLTIDDTIHGIEKSGATETVHAMLITEDKDVIKVFPAWQADCDGTFRNLRMSGGFLVSAAFDGKRQEVSSLSVTSEAGKVLTVASPWADAVITDSKGNVVNATLSTAPNHPEEITYTFATVAGETYTFQKGEASKNVDKSALQKAVNKAASDQLDTTLFTPASFADYTEAIANANVVLVDEDATVGNVSHALAAIKQAFDKLTYTPTKIATFSAAEKTYSVNNTGGSSASLYTDWKTIDGGSPVDLLNYAAGNLFFEATITLAKSGTTLADGSLYNGGVIKLRSVDTAGENNVGWGLGSRGLVTGENHLSICLNEPVSSTTGTMDWSQVNRLNLYIDSVNSKEGQFDMTLSDVAVVDATLAKAKRELLSLWNIDVDETAHTAESVTAVNDAKNKAVILLNDTTAEAEEITQATATLQQALDMLQPKILLGDVNQNGTVTAEDALLALQIATNKIQPDALQNLAADVDKNDDVTANDALIILQFATKKISSF